MRVPVPIMQQPGTDFKSYTVRIASFLTSQPRGLLQLPFPVFVLKSSALTTAFVDLVLLQAQFQFILKAATSSGNSFPQGRIQPPRALCVAICIQK